MVENAREIDFLKIFTINLHCQKEIAYILRSKGSVLYAISENMVSDEEFALLYDLKCF